MNARRSLETAGATLLSAVAFTASSPNVQAADYSNPNQNPANRLAKKYVHELGGRILSIARRAQGEPDLSSINSAGVASVKVIINTGQSTVPGSNGKYTFEAFADDVGKNGLGRNDINNVSVKEGSSPSDDQPLFALRLSTPHPHSHAPNEGGARFWYGAEGTAVQDSGDRVTFSGSVDPNPFATPPSLVLDRGEVSATGRLMDQIVLAALNDRPTQLEEPPFGPLQHEG